MAKAAPSKTSGTNFGQSTRADRRITSSVPAYKIIFTPEALADLQALHAYVAVDSADNAARLVERILDTIEAWRTCPVASRRSAPAAGYLTS